MLNVTVSILLNKHQTQIPWEFSLSVLKVFSSAMLFLMLPRLVTTFSLGLSVHLMQSVCARSVTASWNYLRTASATTTTRSIIFGILHHHWHDGSQVLTGKPLDLSN